MTELSGGDTRDQTYRFAPLDRSGWLLGLGASQCLLLGGAIFVSGGLLQTRANPIAVLVPLAIGAALAFGAWEGRRLHEWLPVMTRHQGAKLLGATTWRARLPLLSGTPDDDQRQPSLPDFLDGLGILDGGPVSWAPAVAGVGVVIDRRERTVTASLPVVGREFSLAPRTEQERILAGWGDVLGGFCTERGPVARVRVTEWAAPSGVGEHERFLVEHGRQSLNRKAREDYEALLRQAGPMATGHTVLLSVTVDQRRVKATTKGERSDEAATRVLLEELRLLSARMDTAGLRTLPPLSTRQTAAALRHRLDPTVAARLSGRRSASLAEAAGLVRTHNAGPLATESEWGHVRVDGSLHRTYWVAEWPRLDVPPNWLEPMLLQAGGVRTFTLLYEPVAPSRSQRRVDRDSTRLAADEEQRMRGGFRVGARHRRAQAAVLERESELVAGYLELEYAGFVTVTAPDTDALRRCCAEYEQIAAQAGLELRPLDGRHDLGLVCSLPVGRGLAPRRVV